PNERRRRWAYIALRMSDSTPSACRPEMKRRPTMSSALARPITAMSAINFHSNCSSRGWIARSITLWLMRTSAIAAACESAARTIEMKRDQRYGRRNPSKRANVCRFGCFSRSTDDPNAECIHGLPARFYPAPMALPLESVPNFSEGRDLKVIAALEQSLSRPGRLLDIHTDWDHHRSVFTIVGSGDELVETLLA